MLRQILLDTETTGLSTEEGHRIIEIGCLEMVNRRLTGKHFHRYLNPERKIDPGAVEVHGLTAEFLSDKPLFSEIFNELLAFIDGAELIIHNAPFDVGFLNYEFKQANRPNLIQDHCSILDTLQLARRKHPGQRNSLDALCQRYNVDNSNRQFHGALLDAELLAQVYVHLTGGQTQLFGEAATQEKKSEVQIHQSKKISNERQPLPIILATPTELALHEEFLTNVLDSGNCQWPKEVETV